MKLDFAFLSRDTADLVRRSIRNQSDWLADFQSASVFDIGDSGDCVGWADCNTLPCFGDDEDSQMLHPGGLLESFSDAQSAHLAVHHLISHEHPVAWMFWAEGSSGQGIEDLSRSLSELAQGSGSAFLSDEAFASICKLGAGRLPSLYEGFVATPLFGVGDHKVSLKMEMDVRGYQASLESGDAEMLAAVLQSALHLEGDDKQVFEDNLDLLASQLKSTMEELESARVALQGYLSEALEFYRAAAQVEDEDRDVEATASRAVSGMVRLKA